MSTYIITSTHHLLSTNTVSCLTHAILTTGPLGTDYCQCYTNLTTTEGNNMKDTK